MSKMSRFSTFMAIVSGLVLATMLSLITAAFASNPSDTSSREAFFLTMTPGTTQPPRQINAPVYIESYRVQTTITNQIARTQIEQVFVNESSVVAEGTYVFPLPPEVTISDLTLKIDGQSYHAEVLEKTEAAAVYQAIVRQQRDPALLQYIGTNAIQANVFPIPSGAKRTLEIEYSQVVTLDNNLFHYVYPLRTEYLSSLPVGQLSLRVEVESQDPISNIYSSTHQMAIQHDDPNEFVAGFETTNTFETNDFHLYYGVENDAVSVNVLTYRESSDEDGFFLAMIAPPIELDEARVIPKDVILVLDTSGSMEGEKWAQARDAANFILDNLNPGDRFNVVLFSSGVRTYANTPQSLDFTEDAKAWVASGYDAGGTNIDQGLQTALAQNDGEHQMVILFLTDGLASEGVVDTPLILENVAAQTAENIRIFTFGVGDDVNTFLLDELTQRHNGASEYVRPFEKIDEVVANLYGKVSSPVLTDLVLEFTGVAVYDQHPARLPDLFAGSQILVAGRYRREEDSVTLTLRGKINGEAQVYEYGDLEFRTNAGGDALLARLWATRRIGYLLNEIRLHGENPELVESIIRLSTRYGIITPYTSFLITEDQILGATNQENIINQMNPTATALAGNASGSNAIDAAQSSGDLSNQGVAPTAFAFVPTASAAAPMMFTAAPTMAMLPSSIPGTQAPEMTSVAAIFTPTALPTGTPTTTPATTGGSVIRTVADRVFIYRDETWIDTTYDPDTMETIEIEFLSDEYFDLLAEDERVGDFYSLGEHIIFVLDEVAYEIVPIEE